MISEEAIVKEALDGNFDSREQQERWLADQIRNAYTNGFIAGQEAQHRKTWALAMEKASNAKVCVPNAHIGRDFDLYMAGICQALTIIRNLPCPPIEATKDK